MSPLSIYIHWPFCKSKCPYCDFNSHVRDSVDHARWRAALLRELATYADKLPDREVVSIFFGGGTPSLMQADTVAALIDAVGQHWQMAKDVEITLEANPTSVEAERFKAFHKAGVNRVSLGVQSLKPVDLTFLGRQHSADEALAAVKLARDIFPRMSFDLIYARPGQTLAEWEGELTEALTYARDHLSLYQLTIEENTAFHHAYHSGKFALPEENVAADMYELTESIMSRHGMPGYEISNYAKPGQESRHNLTYWRGDDYIGVGPGAHGRYTLNLDHLPLDGGGRRDEDEAGMPAIASAKAGGGEDKVSPLPNPPPQGGRELERGFVRFATETMKSPERWLEKVETTGTGLTQENTLTAREHREELVMMGLRLNSGINYVDWYARTGRSLQDVLSKSALQKLSEQSLITADEHALAATDKGRLLLNSITTALLTTTD